MVPASLTKSADDWVSGGRNMEVVRDGAEAGSSGEYVRQDTDLVGLMQE